MNQKINDFLERSIRAGKLAHAYLFAGPETVDKEWAAKEFAKKLQGTDLPHPDVIIVNPEKNEISINQIRQLQHQLSLFAYQGPYKIAIINQIERISGEAANALLKTLEEPTPKTILILVTSFYNQLLPTIVSRCQLIKFPSPSIKSLATPEFLSEQKKRTEELIGLINMDLTARYNYADKLSQNIDLARRYLKNWLIFFRDLMLVKVGCPEYAINVDSYLMEVKANAAKINYSLKKIKQIIKSIKETDLFLTNPSINAKLVLEILLLEL